MEKFIVSARKYRPQNFSTVVGQSHITTTLKNAIANNQLAHAFLFCGPRGVGKTTCARILAKTINCETKTAEGEACNTCNSCVSFDNGTSLNIHELDAASNNSVDDIRSLVDQVRFAPQAGEYKVYIVDEVHMLSQAAFNAFLKTLEEPPPFAIFILATTEKHKILPTILSRCQIFDFKRITTNDTVEHLKEICDKEHITAENAALHIIAQKSEGCMRDSLSILDKIVSFTGGQLNYSNTLEHLNILDEDYFFKLLQYAIDQQLTDALLLFDTINQKGFEGDTFLEGLLEFFRNLLVSKDAKAAMLLDVATDFKNKYIQAATELSASWVISAINCMNDAAINYKQSRNKRLSVEMALIKLCYLNQAIELSNDGEGLSKKKRVDAVKPIAFKGIQFIKLPTTTAVVNAPKNTSAQVNTQPEATLTIEQEKQPLIPTKTAATSNTTTSNTTTKKPGLGSLSKIRERLLAESNQNNQSIALTNEHLQEAWQLYIEKLQEQKKHPFVTQFKAANVQLTDENTFNIITGSSFQQKFIEQERSGLINFLQQRFNNKFLKYNLIVEETMDEEQPVDETKALTKRQQWDILVSKYPLIKQFRDRLNLELDY
ncbi:DNA polymerase III subunit gamma/tau [Ferruginibacter yonginensis]|uniref:DNA polymerase III subunit gamma/tau n=1 Tax=Ferruginibacter yonginensis TaxID=1310416 RepID=A0ABV8QWQ5_9BACT